MTPASWPTNRKKARATHISQPRKERHQCRGAPDGQRRVYGPGYEQLNTDKPYPPRTAGWRRTFAASQRPPQTPASEDTPRSVCRPVGGAAACRGGPGRHLGELSYLRWQAEAHHPSAIRQTQPVAPTMQGHLSAGCQRGRQHAVPDGKGACTGLYRPGCVHTRHAPGRAGDAAGCRRWTRHGQTAKERSCRHLADDGGPQCRRRLAPAGGAQTGAAKFRRRGGRRADPGWTATAETGRGPPNAARLCVCA